MLHFAAFHQQLRHSRNALLCSFSATEISHQKHSTLLFFSNRNLAPETPLSAVFWQQKFDTINDPLYCLLATEISQEILLCGLSATEISHQKHSTAVFQQQKFHTRNTLLSFSNRNFTPETLLFFSNRNFTPETLRSAVFQQQKFHTRNAPLCFLTSTEISPETL